MVLKKKRASRRSAGLVSFRGVDTLGWAGPATEVVTRWCCYSCADAGAVQPGHGGCARPEAAARLVEEGLLVARHLDGEWRLQLTEMGVVQLAAIHERRCRRNAAGTA